MLSDAPPARRRRKGSPAPFSQAELGDLGKRGECDEAGGGGGEEEEEGAGEGSKSLQSTFLRDPFYRAFSSGFPIASLVSRPEPGLRALPAPSTPHQHPQAEAGRPLTGDPHQIPL